MPPRKLERMPEPLRPSKGQLTIRQLQGRAGNPQPRYTPIIVSTLPASKPGWLDVTVSLEPGRNVVYRVPESRHDPRTIWAILETAPALYSPVGLTADLYAPEG